MKKIIRSFGYAFKGIKYCLPGTNFKVQLLVGILVFIAGFLFKVSATEWIVLIICSVMVLSLEMLNTAIEKMCDLVSTDFHPQIEIIKDVAAGAVLICSIGSAIVGLIIFLPKMYFFINHLH